MYNFCLFFLISLFCGFAKGSVLSNVRLVNHVGYIVDVISETVRTVERLEWCNLKLPDLTVNLNEVVLDRHVSGTVNYTNGFTVAIQHVDIQQATVQQVWSFNTTDQTATVSLRGTLRMHNVAIGYDAVADLDDGSHRYTAKYVHPLISFAFSVNKNIHNDFIEVTVVGTVPRSTTLLSLIPTDSTSDVLATVFDATTTAGGINAWGTDVFQPITLDLTTKIEFPELCYNCPA